MLMHGWFTIYEMTSKYKMDKLYHVMTYYYIAGRLFGIYKDVYYLFFYVHSSGFIVFLLVIVVLYPFWIIYVLNNFKDYQTVLKEYIRGWSYVDVKAKKIHEDEEEYCDHDKDLDLTKKDSIKDHEEHEAHKK